MKLTSSALIFALLCAVPAFADVAVATPKVNSTIGTPFVLAATASPCSGQAVSAMGYSFDSGTTTILNNVTSVNLRVSAPTGSHTLHVKSWGNKGASCAANVPVTVSSSAPTTPYTDVKVSQPTGLSPVVSPFPLIASGAQCNSQAIGAFGFSIDNSSDTTIVSGASVNASVTAPPGAHTLHVKSWGNKGASCVTNIAINVATSPSLTVPSSAIAVRHIEQLTNWVAELDTATGAHASAWGNMGLINAPTLTGMSRQFATTTSGYGGERYHISFGADTYASNFLYDGWVYLGAGRGNIANLEFDLNQVTANGETVIYGFQCDSWTKTWDYTANTGTAKNPHDTWIHSTQACSVADWTTNAWHHVQISYSRDNSGYVTYKAVWLDGVEQDINATVYSSFALEWGCTLLSNFQVDGNTSSSSDSVIYLHDLTIYRW